MGYFSAIAGGLMDIAGTALMSGEADSRIERQRKLANTPGIDTGMLTGQALTDMLQYLPQAAKVEAGVGAANQATLSAQEEAALPGIGDARKAALGQITGLFSDDAAWLKGVQRRGAALGLSSGLFGSQAGQLRTLQLSDREKMARTSLGTGLLGSLIGSMRLAPTPGVQAFLGPRPNDLISLRSQERAQKMSIESGANMLPTGLEKWGSELQEVGKSMAGVGMGEASQGNGWKSGGGNGANSFGMNAGNYDQYAAIASSYGMG